MGSVAWQDSETIEANDNKLPNEENRQFVLPPLRMRSLGIKEKLAGAYVI